MISRVRMPEKVVRWFFFKKKANAVGGTYTFVPIPLGGGGEKKLKPDT